MLGCYSVVFLSVLLSGESSPVVDVDRVLNCPPPQTTDDLKRSGVLRPGIRVRDGDDLPILQLPRSRAPFSG